MSNPYPASDTLNYCVWPYVDAKDDPHHVPMEGDKWFQGMTHTKEARAKISAYQKVAKIGNTNALGHKKTPEAKAASKRDGISNGRATAIYVDGFVYPTIEHAKTHSGRSDWQLRNKNRYPRLYK